jgi:hypothetical protein
VSGKTVAYLDNGDIVLRHDDQSVRIPSSIIDEEHGLEAIDGISACFSEERVYVCLYSTGSGTKTVRCIRVDDGEQLWAAKVFAGYPHAPAWVSSRRDYVDLRLAEDSVVVFGSTGQSFFIEAFYFKSGAPRFRFSTSYGSARKGSTAGVE